MLKDLREEISKIIYQSGYNKENFGGLMATLVDVVFTFAEQNTGIVLFFCSNRIRTDFY